MTDHAQAARDAFLSGYSCCQAVMLAFADDIPLDRETLLLISSSFGGGMGRLREVCGAFSGVIMVAGLLYGYTQPKDPAVKNAHYARVQDLAARFREENGRGSIVCREILGLEGRDTRPVASTRTAEYYQRRPCPDTVAAAARALEQYIAENPPPPQSKP